jgi:hypothetical protein
LHQHASAGVARLVADFDFIVLNLAKRRADPLNGVGFFVKISNIVPEGYIRG